MSVSHMAFLFVDFVERADLLKRLGDIGTWTVLQKIDALLDAPVQDPCWRTAVPSSLGDVSVAAFSTSTAALAAGAALQREATTVLASGGPFRAAVHEGECLALTRGGRTEFFGEDASSRDWHSSERHRRRGWRSRVAVSSQRSVCAEMVLELASSQEFVTTSAGPYRGARVQRLVVSGANVRAS